jgi:hypothetical protein
MHGSFSILLRRGYPARLALVLSLAAGPVSADAWSDGDCKFQAERKVTLDVAGLEKLEVVGRGGDLKVRPVPGNTVTASGRACASTQALLANTQIRSTREGSSARVFVQVPDEPGALDDGYATLDLEVEAPMELAIEITDTSGDVDIEGVHVARITDSSGDVEARDVSGDLEVSDSSGDLTFTRINGALTVTDSSGDLEIDTAKSVRIVRDSSGDVRIVRVSGDVTIENDSSGDLVVDDVGGNVEVVTDSTGERHIEHVRGAVREPEG